MTNKEKREYISDLLNFISGPFFTSEINRRKKFLSFAPERLYKFRKLDKFQFVDLLDEEGKLVLEREWRNLD